MANGQIAMPSKSNSFEKIDIYLKVIPPSKKDIELMSAIHDLFEEYKRSFGVSNFLQGIEGGAIIK